MVILRKAWKLGAGGRRWDCGGGGEGSPEAEPGGGRVGEGGGALQAHLTEPAGRAPPAGPIWSLPLLLLEGRGDVREEGKVGRDEQEGGIGGVGGREHPQLTSTPPARCGARRSCQGGKKKTPAREAPADSHSHARPAPPGSTGRPAGVGEGESLRHLAIHLPHLQAQPAEPRQVRDVGVEGEQGLK